MSAGSFVVLFVLRFCFTDEPTEPAYYLRQIWERNRILVPFLHIVAKLNSSKILVTKFGFVPYVYTFSIARPISNNIFFPRVEHVG